MQPVLQELRERNGGGWECGCGGQPVLSSCWRRPHLKGELMEGRAGQALSWASGALHRRRWVVRRVRGPAAEELAGGGVGPGAGATAGLGLNPRGPEAPGCEQQRDCSDVRRAQWQGPLDAGSPGGKLLGFSRWGVMAEVVSNRR